MTTNYRLPAHALEYREQGYTVVRSFFTREQARELLSEVERLATLDAEAPAALTDRGIRYTGGIFMRSESTRQLLSDQRVIDFLKPIAGPDLWITMDQAVTKHPGAGVFRWHQDNGYNKLKTEHFQLWIALTPTRKKNGALTLAPGSHKRGLLPHKFMGSGQMEVDADIGDTISIDADEGDLIVFSSLMLHCTGPNEADSTRVAYVAEYMPLHEYAPDMKPPYFVAAEAGNSNAHFIQVQPGSRSVKNQLMYLAPRMARTAKSMFRPVRDAIKGRRPPAR